MEIALWDRFGWGPKDTEDISFKRMRELFLVINQEHVSKDAIENLGSPSEEKDRKMMTKELREKQVNLRPGENLPKKPGNEKQQNHKK